MFGGQLILFPKPSLDNFIRSCTPLAVIPELEQAYRDRVRLIMEEMLAGGADGDSVERLAQFLQANRDYLGLILALTNLSQEKFLRILSAKRFAEQDFGMEWNADVVYRKLQTEVEFARSVASIILEGRDNEFLQRHVSSFYLDQLALPSNWEQIIRDPLLGEKIIRKKLFGEYIDSKGDAIEHIIRQKLDEITSKYGVPHDKGQVQLIGKEVDHVIPSKDDPIIMIMTSYMETTSSSQTVKANEQRELFLKVHAHNIRYGKKYVFVNFIDGAGWLARRSDLRKMHAGCDYVVNLKTLGALEAIICKYVPERYFTRMARPVIVEHT